MKTLSVIIPFFNEEKTLNKSVERLIKTKVANQIILVDDCSNDGSYTQGINLVKKHENITLLQTNNNLGKGGAIKLSLGNITSDLVTIHDADLEYNPIDLIQMKKQAEINSDYIILGSRFKGNKKRNNIYRRALFANKFLSLLFSKFNKVTISDIATCYKMIPTHIFLSINLTENGFGFDTEVLSKSLSVSKKILEIPIEYSGRSYKDGKKIKLKDGIKFAYSILKYRIK
tara:strand:+ start:1650 stop:2339 length:690 start_codon:yes stop_codon:yes gene_type:complete